MNAKEIDELRAEDSFWGFFVDRWRLAVMVIFFFLIMGISGLQSMPLESDPEVKIPIAVVTTVYPGASPQDMEKLVTDRLEEKIKNLDDLDEVTSSSGEGISSITVEFEAQADLTESIRDLRDEVDNARSDLPGDANDPIVTEVSVSDQPIVTISLLSNLPPAQMKQYGEDLQDFIEGMAGVSEADMFGLQTEEVQVLADIQKLEGYGISLSEVVNAISANHVDFPIGSLMTDNFYYTASLKNQFDGANELLDLPVMQAGGQSVYLRDIAEVRDAFAEESTTSQVYRVETDDYRESITLSVKKKSGANITDVVDRVVAGVEEYAEAKFPPQIDVLVTNDMSEFVREDITTLGSSAAQTVAIIFFVLFIALGIREGLLVGMSIPLIFLISFFMLNAVGETLNNLTLFSLILALGLVVDTSIVIMEGIYDGRHEKGLKPVEAALFAIHTYKTPLISGTLTTVFAFLPMMMMTGIMGEYMKHLPITIMITLASSLFVAIFILSSVSTMVFTVTDYFRRGKGEEEKVVKPLLSYIIDPLRKVYTRFLRGLLSSRRHAKEFAVIGLMFVLLIVTPMLAFGSGRVKVQMFGNVDFRYGWVNIELPSGAALEDTARVTAEAEKIVEEIPGLETFTTIIGGRGSSLNFNSSSSSASNLSQISFSLVPKEERELSSYEISAELRENLKFITEADVEIEEAQAGPPVGAPIEARIYGDDVGVINLFAEEVADELREVEGSRDVETDIETGTGEFHFKLKQDRLLSYGLTAMTVAQELRTAVFGNDSVEILRDGEETPIVVSLDFREEECVADTLTRVEELRDGVTICRNDPNDISEIQNLLIKTPVGHVPVSELADIELHPAITTIRHRDATTVVNVRGYLDDGYTPVEAVAALEQKIAENLNTPAGVRVEFGGETEETTESFEALGDAMIVGVFLIWMVLVLQFRSFIIRPGIIIITLPLALIGVFLGLMIMGRNFSFPGFIGIVALLGIVVNDAIVLMDRIVENSAKMADQREAIIQSAGERLQPIMLTTMTTAFGILPLVSANEMWADMAWTIFFGIIFATVLTLVVIPVLYHLLQVGMIGWFQKKLKLRCNRRD